MSGYTGRKWMVFLWSLEIYDRLNELINNWDLKIINKNGISLAKAPSFLRFKSYAFSKIPYY